MPRFSVLITDLDNTLFDWVEVWHSSFAPMLDALATQSGIAKDVLERDFKAVFQKHGTSEYAFAIDELESLRGLHPGEENQLSSIYSTAIEEYRKGRARTLKLFPTVLETLEVFKDRGVLLVGYTESQAFYTEYRLRKLGLDRVLDYLFSPPDHELPPGKTPAEIRLYPAEHYKLRRTVASHTPAGATKPNPELLLSIIDQLGASPPEVVYVGDSLMKDVVMAKRAGVFDVYARYGVAQEKREYELLRRVTHWAPSDVATEKALTEAEVAPSKVLATAFAEILGVGEFIRFRAQDDLGRDPLLEAKKVALDERRTVVECWKTTVEVQQHFNDLEFRVRNFAVTLLTAVYGVSAFSLKENLRLTLFGWDLSMATVLIVAGVAAWGMFLYLDRHYHRLLLGSVNHGIEIENRWQGSLPEIGLATAIGKASPAGSIHSTDRIQRFYVAVALVALISAVAIQCGTSKRSAAFSAVPPAPTSTVTRTSPASPQSARPQSSALSPNITP